MATDSLEAGELDPRIQAAGEGSAEAMGTILQGCRQYLLAVANHAMGPALLRKAGASDAVQETFLEAQRHFADFRGRTRAELLAWLRRILECRLINARRRYCGTAKRAAGREEALGSAEASREPSPSGHAIRNELAEAINRALGRLPEDYRRAVLFRYVDHNTFQEIGARMGCSAEAARKLWNRAVHRLQHELKTLS